MRDLLTVRIERIEHLLDLDRLDEAATDLSRLTSEAPDDPRTHVLWSRLHLLAQRYRESVESAERALALDPSMSQAHALRGLGLRAQLKNKEALQSFGAAVDLEPDVALFHQVTAQTLSDLNRHPEATAAAQRAVETDPHDARSHFTMGYVLEEFDREGAVTAYQKALEIEPQDRESRHNLVRLTAHGDAGASARAYAQMAGESPDAIMPLRAMDEMVAAALQRTHRFLAGGLLVMLLLIVILPRPWGGLAALLVLALLTSRTVRRFRPVVQANPLGTGAWLRGYRRRDPLGALWMAVLTVSSVLALVAAVAAAVVGGVAGAVIAGAILLIYPAAVLSWIRAFVQGRRIERERVG